MLYFKTQMDAELQNLIIIIIPTKQQKMPFVQYVTNSNRWFNVNRVKQDHLGWWSPIFVLTCNWLSLQDLVNNVANMAQEHKTSFVQDGQSYDIHAVMQWHIPKPKDKMLSENLQVHLALLVIQPKLFLPFNLNSSCHSTYSNYITNQKYLDENDLPSSDSSGNRGTVRYSNPFYEH